MAATPKKESHDAHLEAEEKNSDEFDRRNAAASAQRRDNDLGGITGIAGALSAANAFSDLSDRALGPMAKLNRDRFDC